MKKVKEINWLLIFSLVISAAVSFGPCIRQLNTYIIPTGHLSGSEGFVESLPYMPFFFCIVSAIEIVLVIVSNRRVLRLIGMVLHLFKMVVPFTLYSLGVFEMAGGLVATTYTFSWVGYVLLGIGVITLILYVSDIIKNNRRFS